MGTKLTSDDVARLRMKAKRGTLTPEEQVLWAEHVGEQSPAPPPPSTKKSKRGVDVHKISELVPKLFGALLLAVALVTFGPPLARVGIDIVGDMFHAGNPQADGAITVSSQVDHYNRSVSDLGNGGGYGGADVYVCGDKMVWVDFNSESTTLDKYWVMSGEDYWGKDADGNPVMLTNYYQCDRDGNKTSGPYTSANEVPSPDGWLDVSSEIQSIKVLERGAHGWEYRGELSEQSLAKWLSDNGLGDGSTREQVIPLIRYDYDGYAPMTGAYDPESDTFGKSVLDDSYWVETISDSQMFANE